MWTNFEHERYSKTQQKFETKFFQILTKFEIEQNSKAEHKFKIKVV
jgi:hypothetical protein